MKDPTFQAGLTDRFRREIKDDDSPWIVGVSGGPDSMALSALLAEVHPNLILAHVNYHKRESADRDEKIVADFAGSKGLIFEKLDAGNPEGNFQDWARKVRYDFYGQLAEKYGASRLFLGHHQDDHLETYLIQKERQMTPQVYGLKRSYIKNGLEISRPLLSFTKKELEDFCKSRAIEYGLDESNLSDAYLRNRIRHHVLSNLSSDQRHALLDEIERENEKLDKLRESSEQAWQSHWIDNEEAWFILGEAYTKLGMARPSKKALLDQVRILKEARKIETAGGEFNLRILKDRDQLLFFKKEPYWNSVELSNENLADGMEMETFFTLQLSRQGKKIEQVSVTPNDFPLILRPARAGDSISMRYGRKKLHRFFIDRQIPKALRAHWPVLENASNEVIWVYGLGADARHFEGGPTFYLNGPELAGLLEEYDIMNVDF